MRFCILGAGSGGRAFAAYLASKGHTVSLWNRSFTRISDILQKGGIEAEGALNGFFPIQEITRDLKSAIRGAEVIMVVTPASAHKTLAKKVAKFLTAGQIIILNPGRTFGSIEFTKVIKDIRGELPIFVGETQTLLFTSRALPNHRVKIIKIKDSVKFSAFPEEHTDLVYERIKDVFPQLIPVDNYLELTLNNIGMLLHPSISLFNAGPMDIGKSFRFYMEGATPRICQVLEKIEYEINQIINKLGLRQFRFHQWASDTYGVEANSIYDAIQQIDAYKNIYAPMELNTRYFTEDVPTGLIPLSSLGKKLGISTPTIDSIIHLSSILCGIDFIEHGRTIDKLNLNRLIQERVDKGDAYSIEYYEEEKIPPKEI
ncbi:MAG: NAD/NADP octopine/nopaline dehydrogenase family protein [Promethearchaeota archaeon]